MIASIFRCVLIQDVQLKLLIDLRDAKLGESVNLSLGYDQQIYLLDRPSRIVQTNGDYVAESEFPDAKNKMCSSVHPLPNNEFLLVVDGGQSKVYSIDGELKREFFLGHDIMDVQTTSARHIWVRYDDMGISENAKLMGDGLVVTITKWDVDGNLLFKDDIGGLWSDAIQVRGNDVWVYGGRELVHLQNEERVATWKFPIYSSRMAIWDDYVWFSTRTLVTKDVHGTVYHLGSAGKIDEIGHVSFPDTANALVDTRFGRIVALKNKALYSIDLQDIISQLGVA